MAWRPSDWVLAGELDNATPGWTVGWVRLQGREEALQLKLATDDWIACQQMLQS